MKHSIYALEVEEDIYLPLFEYDENEEYPQFENFIAKNKGSILFLYEVSEDKLIDVCYDFKAYLEENGGGEELMKEFEKLVIKYFNNEDVWFSYDYDEEYENDGSFIYNPTPPRPPIKGEGSSDEEEEKEIHSPTKPLAINCFRNSS